MEAENDHPKISQTNDPMMELPESDENVNLLSTAVITQDVTFTNEAEQLRDINGELRKDGVDEDDCFTFTAVAKAFSNDSFKDDLVDNESIVNSFTIRCPTNCNLSGSRLIRLIT